MRDSLTVLRKELTELVGNRHSARGALVQGGILVLLIGVFVPAVDPKMWRLAAAMAALYLAFPGMLAAGVAADSFAGERERRTLETLLATPLADGAIFAGKAAAAILFSAGVTSTALLASIVTVVVKGAPPPPLAHVAAVLGGGVGIGLITTAISIFVSARVTVARSAQQVASVVSLLVAGGTLAIVAQLGIHLDWTTLPRIDAVLASVGVLALRAALGTFRRDRMFEDR
jgi:ABC-2 type transport system permease protein